MKTESLSKILVVLFVVTPLLLCVQSETFSADWPQIGFDAQRTSYNPYEFVLGPSNVEDLEVLWTNYVPCTINHPPTVVDDIVYYGHYCGEFRAVDAATGATVWTKSINTTHTGQAIVGGVAYVTARCTYDNCGEVYAFDASSGTTLWTWDPGPSQVNFPVVDNGVLYVRTSPPNTLHALDTATGAELWSASPGGAPAVSGGVVYTSWKSDTLEARDSANGNVLWTGIVGVEDLSMPVVGNGVVYVHSDLGHLYAFDASGCGDASCSPLWEGVTQIDSQGPQPPAVAEGKLYVGAGDTYYAFDANGCGGSQCPPLWTSATACSFTPKGEYPPSVANGVVYSTCDNSYLYAFDASTGDTLWHYFTAGTGYPMRSSPAIVDGRLFHAATFDFRLYAFNPCEDNDEDGFRDEACGGTDCDDSDPDVNPGQDENCANGIDDNCDGAIDDADCSCGGCCADYCITAPATGMGNTCGAGNDYPVGPSEEHVYEVTIPSSGTWVFDLCGSWYDTVVLVGTSPGTYDVGWDDDGCGFMYGPSRLALNIPAGTYYVTIEGYYSSDCGEYVLSVSPASSPRWSVATAANASVYGFASKEVSGISNPLSILLLPVGMIILLKVLRKRK